MRMSAALTSSYSPIAPARPPSRIMSAFPSEPAKESHPGNWLPPRSSAAPAAGVAPSPYSAQPQPPVWDHSRELLPQPSGFRNTFSPSTVDNGMLPRVPDPTAWSQSSGRYSDLSSSVSSGQPRASQPTFFSPDDNVHHQAQMQPQQGMYPYSNSHFDSYSSPSAGSLPLRGQDPHRDVSHPSLYANSAYSGLPAGAPFNDRGYSTYAAPPRGLPRPGGRGFDPQYFGAPSTMGPGPAPGPGPPNRIPDPPFFEGGSCIVPALPVTQKRPKARIDGAARKRICQYAEVHPDMRQADIAAVFHVERSTVSKILKQKHKWMAISDEGGSGFVHGRSPATRPAQLKPRSPPSARASTGSSIPSPHQTTHSPMVAGHELYPEHLARGHLPSSGLGLNLAQLPPSSHAPQHPPAQTGFL